MISALINFNDGSIQCTVGLYNRSVCNNCSFPILQFGTPRDKFHEILPNFEINIKQL